MKLSVENAIQKIMSLRSEFEDSDLREAIIILSKTEDFGSASKTTSSSRDASSRVTAKKKAKSEPLLSKVVVDLETNDPGKFQLLSEFDRAMRHREVLRSMEVIREAGMALDKDFDPGKSRKSAIPRLMKILAGLPIDEINVQLSKMLELEQELSQSDEAYSKLAAFIIGRNAENE